MVADDEGKEALSACGRDEPVTEVSLFDYMLPEELVAPTPAERRDESRLLCLDRRTGAVAHRRFRDISGLLGPDDLLIVNDARVIPARLAARRQTGGAVEVLLVRPLEPGEGGPWLAMLHARGKLRRGELIHLDRPDAELLLVERRNGGCWVVTLRTPGVDMRGVLEYGRMPLPPYVLKALGRIRGAGTEVRALTLLVGPGTFRPVMAEHVESHELEPEAYHLPAETAAAVRAALQSGRRIVATGTTCCRVLEYVARQGAWQQHSGWTDLFIYPPFEFKAVAALITNFHLPRSTLLMLVCAFAGRERVLDAYRAAVRERYRFYSYGDAMFIY